MPKIYPQEKQNFTNQLHSAKNTSWITFNLSSTILSKLRSEKRGFFLVYQTKKLDSTSFILTASWLRDYNHSQTLHLRSWEFGVEGNWFTMLWAYPTSLLFGLQTLGTRWRLYLVSGCLYIVTSHCPL